MSWLFGDYLQALINEKDWTASKLARKAGLSHVYMSQLLRGEKTPGNKHTRISIDTITALAKALGVPEHNLMLAYKGIDPNLMSSTMSAEGGIYEEVYTFALKVGVDLCILPLEIRAKIESGIVRKTQIIMDSLVQDELEQLGFIAKKD